MPPAPSRHPAPRQARLRHPKVLDLRPGRGPRAGTTPVNSDSLQAPGHQPETGVLQEARPPRARPARTQGLAGPLGPAGKSGCSRRPLRRLVPGAAPMAPPMHGARDWSPHVHRSRNPGGHGKTQVGGGPRPDSGLGGGKGLRFALPSAHAVVAEPSCRAGDACLRPILSLGRKSQRGQSRA